MKHLLLILFCFCRVSSYSFIPTQYHIQTDKGPDRYFRYQTYNGQFRKEKRLEDGSVVGSYGWVDATGLLRLYDYFADDNGYRVVRTRIIQTDIPTPNPSGGPKTPVHRPIPEQTLVFDSKKTVKKKIRPANTHRRKPSTQKLRPLFVKKKVTPSSHQTSTAGFGSKIQPQPSSIASTTQDRRKKGTPPGYGLDERPGGRLTINFDIGNQYRKEKLYPDGYVVGEHGYVDPFGILRKTYYRSGSAGLEEVKRSYWVGARSPGS